MLGHADCSVFYYTHFRLTAIERSGSYWIMDIMNFHLFSAVLLLAGAMFLCGKILRTF